MNIYGENCHRCEQKTRRKRKDKPTCGHCIEILESRHEEIRKCPVDETEMRKEILHNIILDRCSSKYFDLSLLHYSRNFFWKFYYGLAIQFN